MVTVLFADLVGSTALTERLDPEEAREVVGRFYATVQTAVEPFGGTVANLLGDAVLAVFGLPIAHEDDPERAVRAGLALRDVMPLLNERLDQDHGVLDPLQSLPPRAQEAALFLICLGRPELLERRPRA